MKYIKTYENIDNEPKVDDYVLCEEETKDENVKEYVKTHIGQILIIEDLLKTMYNYKVFYKNSNKYFGNNGNCRSMERNEIIHWSKNKEDLLPYLTANKYNL